MCECHSRPRFRATALWPGAGHIVQPQDTPRRQSRETEHKQDPHGVVNYQARLARDHVQCVPEWRFARTFIQVMAVSPEVCKTVG